ncbi:MAG: hypothetical protein ACE5HC_13640 [Candidatus Binatia bacterium]
MDLKNLANPLASTGYSVDHQSRPQSEADSHMEHAVAQWQQAVAALYTAETGTPGLPPLEWRKKHINEIKLLLTVGLNLEGDSEVPRVPADSGKRSWISSNPHLARAPIAYMIWVIYVVIAIHELFLGTWSWPPCDSVASCGLMTVFWYAGIALLFISTYFGTWLLFEAWTKSRELYGTFRRKPEIAHTPSAPG